jgi:hypothetical protein
LESTLKKNLSTLASTLDVAGVDGVLTSAFHRQRSTGLDMFLGAAAIHPDHGEPTTLPRHLLNSGKGLETKSSDGRQLELPGVLKGKSS